MPEADSRREYDGPDEEVERELKFLVEPETLRAALSAPLLRGRDGADAWRTLRTVYFDTDDDDLAGARIALRVRRSDDGWVMGLKREASGGGAFDRRETEVALASGVPDLSRFDKAIAREVTDVTGDKPLRPKFGSEIRRATRTVDLDGSRIEVAFDEGRLFAGEQSAPTAEIELELKSGPPPALFDLGLGLLDAFPARLGLQSKAERARALGAAPSEPVHAVDPKLRPATPLDGAIAIVLRNGLAHMLANLPALEGGDKVEAVHQMRVGARRLRSAMDLFGEAFPTTELNGLRVEAKRIGGVLGEARDWDVLVKRLREGPLARFAQEPGFEALASAVEAKSAAGHVAAGRLVDEGAIARFALKLERFVAARGWRESGGDITLRALDEPAAAFAARTLDRLDRKARRRGRGFRKLAPDKRHKLRIAVKHLRYATEFFAGIFDKESADRFVAKASRLQDALGELNDAAIGLRLVRTLGPARDLEFAHAAGVVIGYCARESDADGAAHAKAWRDVLKAAKAWRDVYA